MAFIIYTGDASARQGIQPIKSPFSQGGLMGIWLILASSIAALLLCAQTSEHPSVDRG